MKFNWHKFKSLLIIAFTGSTIIASFAFSKNNNNNSTITNEQPLHQWTPPKVPTKMTFCTESVPLNRWDIKESLDHELLINYYMNGTILYILKLASRAFPTIEKILKENNIPDDFKYLCVAESALQNQTSPAGAKGYWQFLKETGRRYGLEVNDEVDERYNLEKATQAACGYLQDAYNKLGSWTAAAASYNCGIAGYSRYSSEQHTSYYYDLMLPEETNRYIFRILALKQILSHAQEYGYVLQSDDIYQPIPTRKIIVSQSIPNLVDFAINNGSNYKMLKLLNPWLRSQSLTINNGKTYIIELPLAK